MLGLVKLRWVRLGYVRLDQGGAGGLPLQKRLDWCKYWYKN